MTDAQAHSPVAPPHPVEPPRADGCVACGGAVEVILPQVRDLRFGAPGAWNVARCTHCGLEQIEPRPAPAELGRLYAAHYNFGGGEGGLYHKLRLKFLTSPLYRLWLALDGDVSFHGAKGAGRLLDVGCNEGRGLTLYARNGFSAVEGLETNPVAAAAARARGFAVYECDISEHQPAQRYDVLILSNVLEHALDPAEMLGHVKRLLVPGGQVWISCPNARSWARSLFGRGWINWHPPFHIVHFDAPALDGLLRRCGFEPVAAGQVTPALWAAQSLIGAAFAKPDQPTRALRNPLLVMGLILAARGLLFPLLWLGNRLGRGDCLTVAARTTATDPR